MKKVWTGVRCAHLRIRALNGLRVSGMGLASCIGAWCLLRIAGVGLDYRSDICEFEWTMQRKHHAIWSASGGLPVYRQIYQRIRSEILSGRLAAGARLPSSRTLASELA